MMIVVPAWPPLERHEPVCRRAVLASVLPSAQPEKREALRGAAARLAGRLPEVTVPWVALHEAPALSVARVRRVAPDERVRSSKQDLSVAVLSALSRVRFFRPMAQPARVGPARIARATAS